jgi:hypothetical protein
MSRADQTGKPIHVRVQAFGKFPFVNLENLSILHETAQAETGG